MQKWEYLTLTAIPGKRLDKGPDGVGGALFGVHKFLIPCEWSDGIKTNTIQERLSHLGQQGWELVSMNEVAFGTGFVATGTQLDQQVMFTFKRPIP